MCTINLDVVVRDQPPYYLTAKNSRDYIDWYVMKTMLTRSAVAQQKGGHRSEQLLRCIARAIPMIVNVSSCRRKKEDDKERDHDSAGMRAIKEFIWEVGATAFLDVFRGTGQLNAR